MRFCYSAFYVDVEILGCLSATVENIWCSGGNYEFHLSRSFKVDTKLLLKAISLINIFARQSFAYELAAEFVVK
jgi:hypothetical protein